MRKEKRKATRGDVSATVVLLKGDKPLGNFRVLNLSVGGALLVGKPPPAKTKPAAFDVLVRLSTGRIVQTSAEVVREESVADSSVFAIEFAELDPDDHDAIDNLLLTTIEDERDPTALVVVGPEEIRMLLRRQLAGLGHPSFAVGTREDAIRFLETPNRVEVALVDRNLSAKQSEKVLTYLAKHHPKIRRVLVATDAAAAGATGKPKTEGKADAKPGARKPARSAASPQPMVGPPWTRESLARALLN